MEHRAYHALVTRTAQKELLGLTAKIGGQVERTIDRLLEELSAGGRPQDMKRVQGRANTYRIDSGEYRILFELTEPERFVTIFRIRHRRHAYRGL